MPQDLHDQRSALTGGQTRLTDLLEACLAASQSPANRHTYVHSPVAALEEAMARAATRQPYTASPLAGLPVSVKDLFDVAGQPTWAGSKVLADAAPALADSPAVARLRAAGGLIAGRTNMVEFAFSGVGTNPHYGTPVNPADPQTPRVPGGSSSGAAVSVATGAAMVGLGSDTGGSIRIPAALCGLVGFKSTARLVPTQGALPLSTTLDTVAALTRSVRDAVVVHEILAERSVKLAGKPLSACRLAVARGGMLDNLDSAVANAFDNSLKVLRDAGARLEDVQLNEVTEVSRFNATGGFAAAESYAWHQRLITQRQGDYDPRVASRILRGASMSAADYVRLVAERQQWIARMTESLAPFDAVLSPTVPIVAPSIASVQDDDAEFFRVNGLLLRNTAIVNLLDGCAISVPCQPPGQLPVGLMLWHCALHDDAVLDLALQVEQALRTQQLG